MQRRDYRKYNNKKVEIDNFIFDSKHEADFYLRLKALRSAGEVQDIDVHPRYLLQEGFTKRGRSYRPIYYIADFQVMFKDGTIKVYDTKGMRTEVYKLKKKLFEHRYPELTIEEV